MTVYEVFSHSVEFKHKSTVCSSATVFIIFTSFMTVLCPFILVYRSNGFWLRTASLREQPEIQFKHRYILIVETDRLDIPIICSTFPNINSVLDKGQCTLVKTHEVDSNDDGKYDELHFEIFLQLTETQAVYAVKLLMLFDYKLHNMLFFQMESLGFIQFSSSLPGARFDVIADLQLVQRELLKSYGRDFRFNSSIVDPDTLSLETFNLKSILAEYAQRNVSTILSHIYPIWTAGFAFDSPFVLSAIIRYPEETILYRPKFWQVMKWAWMQYLSMLIIFIYVFKSIKTYVFHNQLVTSIKYTPWKKAL